MSDKGAPFTDPDQTDNRDHTITARWNQGEPDAEGWQRHGVLTVTHYVRRGYRATVATSEVRSGDGLHEENLGMCQYAEVLAVPTSARYSSRQLEQVYTNALSELRRQLDAGDADLAAYFPQHS
jgi:hypothetical protein